MKEMNYLKLWYRQPAKDWKTQAMPIGNGNIGGMIYGRTNCEEIQINEITLWAGGPNNNPDYNGGNAQGAYKFVPEVRKKLFAGDYEGATESAQKLLGNQIGYNGYQNLGSIFLDFQGAARTETPQNYRRELDLNNSIQRVSYSSAGVKFECSYFCSNPGNIMVMRLTADRAESLAFRLSLTIDTENAGSTPGNYPALSKEFAMTAEGDTLTCKGIETSSRLQFSVQLKAVLKTGVIVPGSDGKSLEISGAEDVIILMAAGTNYDISEGHNIHEMADFHTKDGDYLDNDDPDGELTLERVKARIDAASRMGYDALLEAHQADYRRLFDRVSLTLGGGDPEYAERPTNELLNDYKAGHRNRYLEELLFCFGRYMLISSSRDSLPANLQGLWNDSNQPKWWGDYHFDINLQMNYWPAFVTNLAETADALVTYVDSLRGPGNVTAREVFGVKEGWLVNCQTTIFGHTGTNSTRLAWSFLPGGAAWICNNLWDYYLFTQDAEVLERVYPIMKEAALFWKGWLVEDPESRVNGVEGSGELVAAPSLSPEQGGVMVSVGTAYDMSLAYMLFKDVIDAAELRGEDEELAAELQSMMQRMLPVQIGDSGQLKEFREETVADSFPGVEIGHRHMSQMMALHPGNLITLETPEWMQAAITALEYRGDGSGNGTGGWSMAQKGSLWARTGNGDKALYYLRQLIEGGGIYDNLFDQVCDTFQIDGNLGYTAAVAEMLLQSHAGYIEPLPALPKDWQKGVYAGLMARGNFETDAAWTDGRLETFTIRSGSGRRCVVRYLDVSEAYLTKDGVPQTFEVIDRDTIAFDTGSGEEYVIHYGKDNK